MAEDWVDLVDNWAIWNSIGLVTFDLGPHI